MKKLLPIILLLASFLPVHAFSFPWLAPPHNYPDIVFNRAPLADDAVFRQTLTVMDGAVAWDLSGERDPRTCVDLDPIGTFESAELVDDPLAATS